MSFTERRFTAQDGLRLYFRDYGDAASTATPVLCLPGLTRNSNDFHDLASRLAPSRRVLCPDYRGRGRSDYDPDPRHYEPRTYLEDLRHLLAVAGVSRVAVVGTSLGGILSMAMGVLMPNVLAGVVLNDIGPDVVPGGLARIIEYIGRDHPQPDWDSAMAHLKTMFPRLSFASDEGWMKLTRGTYREGPDGMLHFDWDIRLVEPMRDGAVPDLWPLFHSLRHLPLMSVRGGRSDVFSAECLERMKAARPDMVSVLVPGCGHAPALDEPEVAGPLDEFLTRL